MAETNEIYHIPAMLKETIEGLAVKSDGIYVDVTFGGGGHSSAILREMRNAQCTMHNAQCTINKGLVEGTEQKQGHLYSFDQDIDALENAKHLRLENGGLIVDDERWMFVHSNFRYLKNWMEYYGVEQIDGLLADLGVSFHHFDCPERGFSFRFSAPLNMRMNQTAKRTAADIINSYSEEELARVFYLYGELNNSRGIAKNICKARAQKPIERTEELVAAALKLSVERLESREIGKQKEESDAQQMKELDIPTNAKKDLARLFQALRIEVNDEMGALREMLVAARDLLKPGGRIAILTYHSLEDRMVKNFLRSGNLEGKIEKDFYGNILTPFKLIEKGREASEEEVAQNPRARSARLRVAERR